MMPVCSEVDTFPLLLPFGPHCQGYPSSSHYPPALVQETMRKRRTMYIEQGTRKHFHEEKLEENNKKLKNKKQIDYPRV